MRSQVIKDRRKENVQNHQPGYLHIGTRITGSFNKTQVNTTLISHIHQNNSTLKLSMDFLFPYHIHGCVLYLSYKQIYIY
jgi:hypothetical protein